MRKYVMSIGMVNATVPSNDKINQSSSVKAYPTLLKECVMIALIAKIKKTKHM